MPKISGPGILIAFEGIDGAGKTTQVNLLVEALQALGEDVVRSKEPTSGRWGQKIRESAITGRMPLEEEIEAFIQDRVEHVQTLIQPSLENGQVVILDRYFYSTIAYQGARGGDIDELDRRMREIAPVPDVVYILDIEPAEAISRIRLRDGIPNEFERHDSLTQVRQVFKRLWEIDEDLWEVEASSPPDLVHGSILWHLLETTLKAKRCGKHYGCEDTFHCLPRLSGNCDWWNLRSAISSQVSEILAQSLPRRLSYSPL